MRRRIRLFLFVGVLVTAVDLYLFFSLRYIGIIRADLIALSFAAGTSYVLNRRITFGGDPKARWVSSPLMFALTALCAGVIDLSVLLLFSSGDDNNNFAKIVAVLVSAVVRWFFYRQILFHTVRKELASKIERPVSVGSCRLSIVVPAYNEGERIIETCKTIHQVIFAEIGEDFEILVVDDGSKDNTADLAEQTVARVIRCEQNKGKGSAIATGLVSAHGRTVVFTDADLAYPASLILNFMNEVEKGWDVVVGNRRLAGSEATVKTTLLRRVGGWGINRLTHLVLLGRFRDTQCGIKGFRGDIAKTIGERLKINGFGFDVEVFHMAEQDNMSLTELPVTLENRAGSSVSLVGDTMILIKDLIKVRRWAGQGEYAPNEFQQKILDGVNS